MLNSPPVSAPSWKSLPKPYHAGGPLPQGATWDGAGTNFAIFSEGSDKVELCLFDSPACVVESQRVRLRERTNGIWHIYLPGIKPGQLYGYRCYGEYDPESGRRFNPNKLLLDPYAKCIGRAVRWDDSVFGYTIGDEAADLSFDGRDSAPFAPLASVINPTFDWGTERRPNRAWHQTLIYEAHVKGLTQLHPDVPESQRGTYAAIGSAPIIEHLRKLAVTAIELMPIHHFVQDRHLLDRGLRNYWGYNSLGFFAPEASYASNRAEPCEVVHEFKNMVKALHDADIEVILDVVYNHSAEGNHLGPTLSFRGNAAYYRTVRKERRYYMDYTGCGNTLNMMHPHSLRIVMDSLRYWVTEMHVDGFRFDLASALARELHDVDKLGAFFDTVHQDPTLATVKLIAEPWDLGEGGYQVGNFPVGWTEWNGKYRDTVRRFWKGDTGVHADIAWRLGGSADLYERTGRRPSASINFVTAHDGFTLHDLVSYNQKHNEANGENNNDGADDNQSWNCGAEGPTEDPAVVALREQQKRNMMCTLLFSQGVPMICAGDEMGRTQGGNNNGYCQDNELSWVHWNLNGQQRTLLAFSSNVARFRQLHPNFHRRSFFEKDPDAGSRLESVQWFRSDGQRMRRKDWEEAGWMRTLGMYLDGRGVEIRDPKGEPVTDDDFLILMNAHHEPVGFTLSRRLRRGNWTVVFDTHRPELSQDHEYILEGLSLTLAGRSLVVLRRPQTTL